MITVTVTAEQPLLLGSRPDSGWITHSHRFVPGSVLRGALAAAWIAEQAPGGRPADSPEFRALFEGVLRYGPLYVHPDALRPLSVFGCKYRPTDACAAPTFDAAHTSDIPDTCPRCHRSPTEAGKGQIDGVTLVERTQVQMREDSDRARDRGLFSREAFPMGTVLTGSISGSHRWLIGERLLRLGGRRSTSGLARLTAHEDGTVPAHSGLSDDGRRLVVRLLSPAILTDTYGRPVWRPGDDVLSDLLGVPARVSAEWIRPVAVGGWNAAANLPKPRDSAVAAGSVYVLDLDAPPDRVGLDRLYEAGLGLRRAEGFGWVTLDAWAPRPLPMREEARPKADPLGEIVRGIVTAGLLDLVLDDVRHAAQTGTTTPPDTVRYHALTAAQRDTATALFALDRDAKKAVAARLDILDRKGYR